MAGVRKKNYLYWIILIWQLRMVLPSLTDEENPNALDTEKQDAAEDSDRSYNGTDINMETNTTISAELLQKNMSSGIVENMSINIHELNDSNTSNFSIGIDDIQPRGLVNLRHTPILFARQNFSADNNSADDFFFNHSALLRNAVQPVISPYAIAYSPFTGQNSSYYSPNPFAYSPIPSSNNGSLGIPYSMAIPYSIKRYNVQNSNETLSFPNASTDASLLRSGLIQTRSFGRSASRHDSVDYDSMLRKKQGSPVMFNAPLNPIVPKFRKATSPMPSTTLRPIQKTTKKIPQFRSIGTSKKPRSKPTKGKFRSAKTFTTKKPLNEEMEIQTSSQSTARNPKSRFRSVSKRSRNIQRSTTRSKFRKSRRTTKNPYPPEIIELQDFLNFLSTL